MSGTDRVSDLTSLFRNQAQDKASPLEGCNPLRVTQRERRQFHIMGERDLEGLKREGVPHSNYKESVSAKRWCYVITVSAGRFQKPHERIAKFDLCLGFDIFTLDFTLLKLTTILELFYVDLLGLVYP